MTRVVLKFTEPAEASDRLPDSTFGEYNMLDERNIFSICDTVKLNSFAEFSFFCVWSLLLQRESGLQVLQLFINKLDAEAKHKFFRWENHQRRNFCINALINFLGQCFFFFILGASCPTCFICFPAPSQLIPTNGSFSGFSCARWKADDLNLLCWSREKPKHFPTNIKVNVRQFFFSYLFSLSIVCSYIVYWLLMFSVAGAC